MQRTIVDVGKRGVLIAHEAMERAAAEAKQTVAAYGRYDFDDPRAIQLDPGGSPFRAGRARTRCFQPSIWNFGGRNLQPFHLRVEAQELRREEAAVVLQVGSREVKCLALDEVLHRIGGDEAGIVAGGVGGPERVAVEQHQDVRAEYRAPAGGRDAVAVQAVDDDVALAVIIALPAAGKLFHEFSPQDSASSRRNLAMR